MEMTNVKPSRVEAIEVILAKLLRIGSVIAGALMAVGLVMTLIAPVAALGTELITIGLVVLVATPVMRVTVAMAVFVRDRDYLFALFCLVVLAALAVGMLIGHAE
jgi:uncharacterized membrane protein